MTPWPPLVALDAEGIAVHAEVTTRSAFRRAAEGPRHNSFLHSYVAKGRLLFTHDPRIEALVEWLVEEGVGVRAAMRSSLRGPPLRRVLRDWLCVSVSSAPRAREVDITDRRLS
jgi:hypothetical protein